MMKKTLAYILMLLVVLPVSPAIAAITLIITQL